MKLLKHGVKLKYGMIMTTKVTIDAHAGWDVAVTLIRGENERIIEDIIVPANTVQDFYIHSGLSIFGIAEIPKEG